MPWLISRYGKVHEVDDDFDKQSVKSGETYLGDRAILGIKKHLQEEWDDKLSEPPILSIRSAKLKHIMKMLFCGTSPRAISNYYNWGVKYKFPTGEVYYRSEIERIKHCGVMLDVRDYSLSLKPRGFQWVKDNVPRDEVIALRVAIQV